MPKINAREQTRNKAQAKKRERNRKLRSSMATPAGGAAKKTKAKPKAAQA